MKKPSYIIASVIFLFAACQSSTDSTPAESNQLKVTSAPIESTTTNEDSTIEENSVAPEATGEALASFISTDYYILDSAKSTLDGDRRIIAYVLANKKEQESNEELYREIIILEKHTEGYTKMASNKDVVLCKLCGGVWGDPYNGIALNKNILKIQNYGGSAWRWGEDHTFRYQNNQWELIGASYYSYWNVAPCNEKQDITDGARHAEDINFSTGKMHIVLTKDNSCEPYEDYWDTFDKKPTITLSDFPGQARQWPNGKIKDGDGE